jgi:hypothetical protein
LFSVHLKNNIKEVWMKSILKIACILIVVFFAGALISEPVWVPAKINGQKGDIVLSPGTPGEMISDLIAIIGCYWSHSGMVIDNGETIRHNTMYMSEIEQLKDGCGIPYMLDPDGLSNGLPGILSEDVDTAYNGENPDGGTNFKLAGGVLLMPTDANEAAYRQYLELAADKLIYVVGYYRVNAYADMFQLEYLNYLVKGVGNHCSGTCWYANYFAGKEMNVATIPPYLVDQCANSLYESVKQEVEDQVGCGAIFAPDVAEDIANQVTNTFGFDRSDDTSDYWRSYVGTLTAHANAPDHLLLNSFTNPLGQNPGVQTEDSSYYGKVVPIEYTDGYYIGDDDDDDDSGCG